MNGTITEVFYQDQDNVEVKLRADNTVDLVWDLIMYAPKSNLITNRVILVNLCGMSQTVQIVDMYLSMLFAENIITMETRNNIIEGIKHAMTWYVSPRNNSNV